MYNKSRYCRLIGVVGDNGSGCGYPLGRARVRVGLHWTIESFHHNHGNAKVMDIYDLFLVYLL